MWWKATDKTRRNSLVIVFVVKLQDGPVELLPFLFLGSAIHSSRRETLAAAGITAVLNVSSTCPNFYEGEFQYLRLTVEDTLAADIRACFSAAIAFIGEYFQTVLVCNLWNESPVQCLLTEMSVQTPAKIEGPLRKLNPC